VHKDRKWRLNIKVKERPFAEGSRDLTCAGAFHLYNRDKNCFGRWLFLSTNGNEVLVIFHTKQVESDSEYLKIGIYMIFYKVWHSSPPFFTQTMANRILRVPANNLIPCRSASFLFSFKGYNGLTSSLAKLVTSRWSMQVKGYLI
jgi:hypothetical protein